jgi:hypothetical protein
VRVATGAWNTGWHHGKGFTQWTGSDASAQPWQRYAVVSGGCTSHRRTRPAEAPDDAGLSAALEEARWRLLRAETSCNIYWGEAWVDRPRPTDAADLERRGAWRALAPDAE